MIVLFFSGDFFFSFLFLSFQLLRIHFSSLRNNFPFQYMFVFHRNKGGALELYKVRGDIGTSLRAYIFRELVIMRKFLARTKKKT